MSIRRPIEPDWFTSSEDPQAPEESVAELPDWAVEMISGDEPVELSVTAPPSLEPAAVPPARVQFAVPACIRPEGADQDYDGSVVNLSPGGVGCVGPVLMHQGDRVWVGFSAALGEERMTLLCEVLWARSLGDEGPHTYGMRFLSMTPEETERIEMAVAERAGGRAGSWPMPVLPLPGEVSVPRRSSPWVSAAAGMVAGIGLALGLSVIPRAGSATSPELAEVFPIAEAAQAAKAVVAQANSADVMDFSGQDVEVSETDPGPAVVAEQALPSHEAPPPEPPVAVPSAAAEITVAKGDVLRPSGPSDEMVLTLRTKGRVVEHVSFWLEGPRRLVVDVHGQASGFSRATYRVEHPLASKLRVGEHPGKTRFVLETSETVDPQIQAVPKDNGITIILRKK